MVQAVILTIGDELTSGRVVDTNSSEIATRLRGAGIETPLHLTCGDDVDAIVSWLDVAHQQADVVITTGGLGPTDDDLTNEAVASYAGVKLELHQAELERIRDRFASRGLAMPESNVKQAMLPAGARVIPNLHGTAPGCLLAVQDQWVVTLPGIPGELAPMLDRTVIPFLRQRLGVCDVVRIRTLKTFGFTESQLAEVIAELPGAPEGLRVGYRPTFPEIHISLTAAAPDLMTADRRISQYETVVAPALGPRLWGYDEDLYPAVVGELLRRKGLRMTAAESCTGGLVGKLMTDIAGSSDYFERGFVTYTNEAKQGMLGVPAEIFAPGGPGAVSEECARAMALGARRNSEADVAVSITGIAGPGGGSEDKPVGTVWIGLSTKDETSARRFFFPGPREWVRTLSAYAAIERLRRHLIRGPDLEPLGKAPRRRA